MLSECHGHIILSGENFKESISMHSEGVICNVIDERLKIYADAGVTFFRDGGDNMGASEYAKKAAEKFGIDYRTPIFAIHKAGYYGKFLGKSFTDFDGFKALVNEVIERGGDFIKIMATGILDFNTFGVISKGALSFDELSEMVEHCHNLGFAVMAHCNGAENITNALRAGVDSIEHGFYIDDHGIELLRETHAVWVPTFAPVGNLIGGGTFPDEVLGKILKSHAQAVKSAADMGCLIAPGSDAGSGSVFPHACTAQEYEYLHKAGITDDVLNRGIAAIKEKFKR